MPHTTQFLWTSAARSHAGRVRERNEDACLELPELGLWAVADGMGGHAVGDFASGMVVGALRGAAPSAVLEDFIADIRRRLQAVNHELRAEAASRNVPLIGSTVAALLAAEDRCACVWAGDSRIYLLREGRLTRLTRDHSQLEEYLSRQHDPGAEAMPHPRRNMITRAVGAEDSLELDEEVVPLLDGDIFLLCSDGLSNELGDADIAAALMPGSCRQAAEALVDLALQRGGRDNISAVVARAEDLYNSDKTVLNPAFGEG